MAAQETTRAACSEHQEYHALIAPSEEISIDKQGSLSKLQAKFRGKRDRDTHIVRLKSGKPICPFLRTKENAVKAMLELGIITAGDVVYDLGCGDGAISIEAARVGARVTGFDIDLVHLATAKKRAEAEGLDICYRSDDIFEVDFSAATVLVMFLVPNMLKPLSPIFKALKPGTRILSYHFPLPSDDWEPRAQLEVDDPLKPPPATSFVYFYTVPGSSPS